MINKNPYLIGQRTLDLLAQIEMNGLYAEDALANNEHESAEEYGRLQLMRELGQELDRAFLADLAAEQIDPQLG